jgi:hypothetical protein
MPESAVNGSERCDHLAANFHQVVHPVLTEENEVAKSFSFQRKSRIDMHKNAGPTPRGRERQRADPGGRRRSRRPSARGRLAKG